MDDRLRATAPDVHAAGDAAEWRGRSYAIIPAAQVEAWIQDRARAEAGNRAASGPAERFVKQAFRAVLEFLS